MELAFMMFRQNKGKCLTKVNLESRSQYHLPRKINSMNLVLLRRKLARFKKKIRKLGKLLNNNYKHRKTETLRPAIYKQGGISWKLRKFKKTWIKMEVLPVLIKCSSIQKQTNMMTWQGKRWGNKRRFWLRKSVNFKKLLMLTKRILNSMKIKTCR